MQLKQNLQYIRAFQDSIILSNRLDDLFFNSSSQLFQRPTIGYLPRKNIAGISICDRRYPDMSDQASSLAYQRSVGSSSNSLVRLEIYENCRRLKAEE